MRGLNEDIVRDCDGMSVRGSLIEVREKLKSLKMRTVWPGFGFYKGVLVIVWKVCKGFGGEIEDL